MEWIVVFTALFGIFTFLYSRAFIESRKVKWINLNISFEEFYFNFSKIENAKNGIYGKWRSSYRFEMYYIPKGQRLLIRKDDILKLRGILRTDRVEYTLYGLYSYLNRKMVKELLQEKLYEMCNPEEVQE